MGSVDIESGLKLSHPWLNLRASTYFGERRILIKTAEECMRDYTAAGYAVMNLTGDKILLGTQKEAPKLWGNFAGGREPHDKDPRNTAIRELTEELGLVLTPGYYIGKPLIVINNSRNDKRPGVGIIWPLRIEEEYPFVLPVDSEIAEIKWFGWGEVTELMDESRPDERLWGGLYTVEVLKTFADMATGKRRHFGGISQINTWFGGDSEYERIKRKEKANR